MYMYCTVKFLHIAYIVGVWGYFSSLERLTYKMPLETFADFSEADMHVNLHK